jgi:hypothetical protein
MFNFRLYLAGTLASSPVQRIVATLSKTPTVLQALGLATLAA